MYMGNLIWGHFLLRFTGVVLKILIASLMAGALLSFFGVTIESLLSIIGQSPESLAAHAKLALDWAVPNIILGSIFILPTWILVYIFLPPGGE